MKNNHAVIICVESVFIEDLIVAFVSSKAFSRQRSGTKYNRRAADQGILFGLRIRDRVSFLSLTLKQGAKFVRLLRARVPIHSTV